MHLSAWIRDDSRLTQSTVRCTTLACIFWSFIYMCECIYVYRLEREYCWQYLLTWSGPPFPYLIITRHLLRNNTYFNWGLRAAAHTTHQSRRFIQNSRLSVRHPHVSSPSPSRGGSSAPVFNIARATRCGDTRRRILDQDFAGLSESTESTDFSTVIRATRKRSHAGNYRLVNYRSVPSNFSHLSSNESRRG